MISPRKRANTVTRRTKLLLVLAVACLPSRTSAQPHAIDALARAVTGAHAPVRCLDASADREEGSPIRSCVWRTEGTVRADTLRVETYGADSVLLQFERHLGSDADVRTFLESIERFGAERGLARTTCRASETPDGTSRGILWRSKELLVHATDFRERNSPPRVLLVATTTPDAFDVALFCGAGPSPSTERTTR